MARTARESALSGWLSAPGRGTPPRSTLTSRQIRTAKARKNASRSRPRPASPCLCRTAEDQRQSLPGSPPSTATRRDRQSAGQIQPPDHSLHDAEDVSRVTRVGQHLETRPCFPSFGTSRVGSATGRARVTSCTNRGTRHALPPRPALAARRAKLRPSRRRPRRPSGPPNKKGRAQGGPAFQNTPTFAQLSEQEWP